MRENQDLARLDRCDLESPPLFLKADYTVSVALDFLAEVSEKLLPEHEPNDAYFRLLLLVLDEIRTGMQGELSAVKTPALAVAGAAVADDPASEPSTTPADSAPGARFSEIPGWLRRTLIYFALWSVRLGGWLPPLNVCIQSGVELGPEEKTYFDRTQDGLYAADFRNGDSWALSAPSRQLAAQMLRRSLPDLRDTSDPSEAHDDLLRFLIQRLEFHFEQRLKTAAVLSQL